MYCHTCACEFVGWTGLCPVCKTPLARELPSVLEALGEPVSYEAAKPLLERAKAALEKKGLDWRRIVRGDTPLTVEDLREEDENR